MGRLARAGEKKGQPAWGLAGWARKGERERGREEFVFFFKFLSNSFFKHSNSNQTKIHAFKS
jgi:hypothetical protein